MTVCLAIAPGGAGLPAAAAKRLRARARRLLGAVGENRSELSIALVDDARMCALNTEWRGKRRTTDVLAFPLREGEGADHCRGLLGDVVIGVETARRRARSRHRAPDDELARLLVHGVLHLLGVDHVRGSEARAMRAEERRLLRLVRCDGPAQRWR
jgi:rRNA maturation RNase YbeY